MITFGDLPDRQSDLQKIEEETPSASSDSSEIEEEGTLDDTTTPEEQISTQILSKEEVKETDETKVETAEMDTSSSKKTETESVLVDLTLEKTNDEDQPSPLEADPQEELTFDVLQIAQKILEEPSEEQNAEETAATPASNPNESKTDEDTIRSIDRENGCERREVRRSFSRLRLLVKSSPKKMRFLPQQMRKPIPQKMSIR